SLPFPDGVFDAVLDGAGIKYYSDKTRALREMLRVVKPGGRVLVTELGMPPGRRPTLRQRLLLLWIPGFREGPPRDEVPSNARDIKLDWDARETLYALEFRRSPDHG
ncbi:MAG: class I SAM-dependent methyltransferase, partial [Gammaproteobacteria bacterium]|nr:class I SAM-dependent methyltransferase [Gammaproteobacteria bacterium]